MEMCYGELEMNQIFLRDYKLKYALTIHKYTATERYGNKYINQMKVKVKPWEREQTKE